MVEASLSSALDAPDAPREADFPHDSLVAHFGIDKPLKLDAGVELSPFQIAYKTYGTLNADRSNAVLVCHALTGDQHVANCTRSPRSRAGGKPWSVPASRSIPSAIS